MEKLIDKLELTFYYVQQDPTIKNFEKKFTSRAKVDGIVPSFPKEIIDFYKETDGLSVKWDYDINRDLCGRMNISKIDYVLESWEEKLWYEGADERLKHFRPLDIFTEEACIGILMDGSGSSEMYYHEFGESEIYSLDIDFKSYFDLTIDAKVFLYWQTYLVELLHGAQGVEVLFKTGMKEVFPDFDLNAFTEKFESLRLSKK